MEDIYKTIEKEANGYFKDKGSKFYAFAYPLADEAEVKEIISALKKEHHSARHHCYAWKLGVEEFRTRANDDGEPSSSAGRPILGQIQSFELTNILIVVVRYFGGTLLGVSGLINAYRSAAADALKNAEIVEKSIERKYRLSFSYNELNIVMLHIKQQNLRIITTRFEESCNLDFAVKKSKATAVEQIFSGIYGVKINLIADE